MTRMSILTLLLVGAAICSASTVSIANPGMMEGLSPEARALLDKQGLVACPSDADQMSDIYESAEHGNRPIFVTTDPLFHAFHVIFDYTLRTVEERELYPALQNMLAAMLKYESQLNDTLRDPRLREALQGNLAYLSVPLSYLDTSFKVGASVAEVVQHERANIEAHSGFAASAVTGLDQDFSQYIPRGHYAVNERRQRYFKAMTYIEQTIFPVVVRQDSARAVQLTRQAILLAAALYGAETDSGVWVKELRDRIRDLNSYIAGTTQDLTPDDYMDMAGRSDVSEFAASDDSVRTLIRMVRTRPPPEIVSSLVWPGESRDLLLSMSLLGCCYIPDGAIMQQLMFDAVGTLESPRYLPMGLDLMAVLGSSRARLLLTQEYHQDRFNNYLVRLDSLRKSYSRLSPVEWNANLYRAWLYALKLNLAPVISQDSGSLIPAFTRTTTYDDKSLLTSSASWTELRHDLILLAQQPVEVTGLCNPPESLVVYVEPKPDVFRQLARMATDLQDELSRSGFKVNGVDDKLDKFRQLANGLADIALGELQGTEIPPQGVDLCRSFGTTIAGLVNFQLQPATGIIFMDRTEDQKQAIVADVATAPSIEQVLEEAVGSPCELYAVIPCCGRQYLALGACYSYFEFTKPMSERMTDEQWQDLEPKPEMPVWTKSFIAR